MGGGDMPTATTNNPLSSLSLSLLGLSSDQRNSLAVAPSLTELLDVSNAMQRYVSRKRNVYQSFIRSFLLIYFYFPSAILV